MRYFSLFAGIGSGEYAIAKIFPNSECVGYSEIDENSIKVYEKHFPDHKNFGDARKINTLTIPQFDLLIAGFPCQSFSQAGLQLEFEDMRGQLFFEVLRFIKDCKPKYFILENVGSMRNDVKKTIDKLLNCQHISINSNLFTAQNRNRVYWCNFPITLPSTPSNKTIESIIVEGEYAPLKNTFVKRTELTDIVRNRDSPCCFTLTRIPEQRGNTHAGHKDFRMVPRKDSKSNAVICTVDHFQIVFDGTILRKWSPEEYEKLQGLPVGYTSILSRSKRYKCVGNCFTISVIVHLCKILKSQITSVESL